MSSQNTYWRHSSKALFERHFRWHFSKALFPLAPRFPTCRPINDRGDSPLSRTGRKENPKNTSWGKTALLNLNANWDLWGHSDHRDNWDHRDHRIWINSSNLVPGSTLRTIGTIVGRRHIGTGPTSLRTIGTSNPVMSFGAIAGHRRIGAWTWNS